MIMRNRHKREASASHHSLLFLSGFKRVSWECFVKIFAKERLSPFLLLIFISAETDFLASTPSTERAHEVHFLLITTLRGSLKRKSVNWMAAIKTMEHNYL